MVLIFQDTRCLKSSQAEDKLFLPARASIYYCRGFMFGSHNGPAVVTAPLDPTKVSARAAAGNSYAAAMRRIRSSCSLLPSAPIVNASRRSRDSANLMACS